MSMAERSMGLGLRALGRLAGSDVVDRLGVRKPAERVLYRATRDGFKAAGAAGRTFKAVNGGGRPARLPSDGQHAACSTSRPTDEQQMLQESFKAFGAEQLRPAALRADTAAQRRRSCSGQAGELGLTMLGVPEELGGAVSERSSVTAVLAAEALAHGDMGLAVALLAPAGVATALALWGDGDQQATYLPAFVEADDAARPPRSRSRSRARCSTRSRCRRPPAASATTSCSTASSRSCRSPRAPSCCSSPRGWRATAPSLFLVEATTDGVLVEGRARRWACAPPRPATCCWRASRLPAQRAARRRRPGRLRRRRAPRAPRLVRARDRHRRARCSTT